MKVLIACGGTGGHIFPGISLAQELKTKDAVKDIILVGTNHPLERKIFNLTGLPYAFIPTAKLTVYNPVKYLLFLIRFTAASFKSIWILLRFNPDIVVGFGGYASFPICISAAIFGKRLFIHEQNCLPGLANKILSVFAKGVAISYKQSCGFFKEKVVYIGNPIRRQLLENAKEKAVKSFDLSLEKFTILVMGGSQGSHRINMLMRDLVGLLRDEDRGQIQIIHIAGVRDYTILRDRYRDCRIEAKVFDFVNDIGLAYASADLVISRAGATAIFEIAALGLPSILIPYRYAGGHQYYNAIAIEKEGGAITADESELTPAILKDKIFELKNNRARLNAISECARRFSVPDAAKRLADYILEI
ncbi:MAG: hypothetical protein AMJ78_06785 [Omnitrophica WOR_2 bacterium SM23_29]|nr:MAG: hypothetical protein AMJ78_06785 [Omnitrophica WOR_2 bacterium SM23_29]